MVGYVGLSSQRGDTKVDAVLNSSRLSTRLPLPTKRSDSRGKVYLLDTNARGFWLAGRSAVLLNRNLDGRSLEPRALNCDLPSHLADTFLHADESHAPSRLQCAFEVEPASVISDAEVEAPSGIEPPNHSVAS